MHPFFSAHSIWKASAFFLFLAGTAGAGVRPVQDCLAEQNALFRRQQQADLDASPEAQTERGDYRHNAELDDRSLTAIKKQNNVDQLFRRQLAAISTDGFPEEDRLSHNLLLYDLDERIADYEWKEYEMPLTQIDGIHTRLARLPHSVPLDSLQHYEDYIVRLRQIPRALESTVAVLRQGEKDGLVPLRMFLDQIPAQCEKIISEDPFLEPARHFPASISPADQAHVRDQIVQVVQQEVLPAYRRFSLFMAQEYLPYGRTSISESSLPDGRRRYEKLIHKQTTTRMTAAEIHALGLREIARINGLLAEVAHKAGYPDLKSYRAALNNDPRYVPQSAQQIVGDFRRYVEQMRSRLPALFHAVPDTHLVVEAMSPSERPNITHYVYGSADGREPSRVLVAISDYPHRKLIGDEVMAYHEGLPGHELQASIEQRQLKNFPEFRRTMRNNAYLEGWAVYAEALGKEVGLFQDPASDYGRLNTELMRAVRLVVDTGIHSKNWSRVSLYP